MSDDSDDDPATLRERVRELEQTVREQQATIEQLMPSRRAVLAGGAGLVGGAALTGQASAQSAAGQVGTSSEPVDVEAASVAATDVTADSVNAGSLLVNGEISQTPTSPDVLFDLSGSYFRERYLSNETTVDGDDTDQIIAAASYNGAVSGIFFITGRSGANGFADIVSCTVGVLGDEISLSSRGTVPRSYSVNSQELQLSIDDSGSTYSVGVTAIGGDSV